VRTFWVVVLDGDNAATTGLGVLDHGSLVQGLDGEGIQDSGLNSDLGQLIRSLESLVEGHTSTDEQDLVLGGLPDHVGLPDLELVLVLVEHGRVGTGSPDEANPGRVGGQENCVLSAHGVTGVEDRGAWNGPEESQVLKSHLRRPVLTNTNPSMRAHTVDVALRNGSHSKLIKGIT